jgi:hypothetical protein
VPDVSSGSLYLIAYTRGDAGSTPEQRTPRSRRLAHQLGGYGLAVDALGNVGAVAAVLLVGAAVRAPDDGYFTAQAARMDYPRFVARRFPIGSGAVESTCKALIAARTKGAGMRWSQAGVQAVASLRALHRSGRWAHFWQTQPQRRHPHWRAHPRPPRQATRVQPVPPPAPPLYPRHVPVRLEFTFLGHTRPQPTLRPAHGHTRSVDKGAIERHHVDPRERCGRRQLVDPGPPGAGEG